VAAQGPRLAAESDLSSWLSDPGRTRCAGDHRVPRRVARSRLRLRPESNDYFRRFQVGNEQIDHPVPALVKAAPHKLISEGDVIPRVIIGCLARAASC
jgi:hypothetical protein